ncbi:conserved membrane hypothetical protein [uncultured Paludibacter sp.]|nr:conserved membrane hypothetical protein [uncultured Paludibacter sp.]
MRRHYPVRKNNENPNNVFLKMHPLARFFISITIALTLLFIFSELNILLRILFAWTAFSLTFLVLGWIVIFTRTVEQIKKKATEDDGSTVFVFFMVVISSFAGLLTVLLLMISQNTDIKNSVWFLPLTIAGILLSWIMIHTIYIFHYAHEYYDADDGKGNRVFGGLEFPNEKSPDYLDFAYFSFVMGCTFQVSDVEISSRRIRRIAMVHGILSFILNTFVVALTINLIAGLGK